MDKLIHADIFFFITTCAIILLTIILAVAFVYVVFIAKNVNYIVTKIKEESDNISGDIAHARQKIREQGLKLTAMFAFLKSLVNFSSAHKTRKKSVKKEEGSEDSN